MKTLNLTQFRLQHYHLLGPYILAMIVNCHKLHVVLSLQQLVLLTVCSSNCRDSHVKSGCKMGQNSLNNCHAIVILGGVVGVN